MEHECMDELLRTKMTFTTATNIIYAVFKCDVCGKYYVKRFERILEIKRTATGWEQVSART